MAVYGVLYEIPECDAIKLDKKEGGYRRSTMEVQQADAKLCSSIYVAENDKIDGTLKPYNWYRALVIAGATQSGFPEAYIDSIKAVEAISDPDSSRAARRMKVLESEVSKSNGERP